MEKERMWDLRLQNLMPLLGRAWPGLACPLAFSNWSQIWFLILRISLRHILALERTARNTCLPRCSNIITYGQEHNTQFARCAFHFLELLDSSMALSRALLCFHGGSSFQATVICFLYVLICVCMLLFIINMIICGIRFLMTVVLASLCTKCLYMLLV